jgi:ParB family chromosome partitioning protein
MAGRRTSLVSLAGAKVDDVPGKSDPTLLTVPLDRLHCTRFNPRRNFGTDDELREFGEKLKKEQLQPAVVVSRAAYLRLWPDEAERVGTASYVIANGERRYRASQLVGRGALEVVQREDVAASRADFLDAVQSENNDRKDLDPIERAIAIETMVTELGGADQVAVYYNKTKGWVSQQRKLLKLTPALQDLVTAGEMPVRVARDIAGLPPEVQATAWQEELERRRLAKDAADTLRSRAVSSEVSETTAPAVPGPPEAVRFTAVNQQPETPAQSVPPPTTREVRFTAVNEASPADAAPAPAHEAIPEQRADRPAGTPAATGDDGEQAPRRVPWENPGELVLLLDHKVEGDDAFFDLFQLFGARALERDAARLGRLAQALAEQAAARTT